MTKYITNKYGTKYQYWPTGKKPRSLDRYAKDGTAQRRILDMHFDGIAPSIIDEVLELPRGQAHAEVVRFWAWQNGGAEC